MRGWLLGALLVACASRSDGRATAVSIDAAGWMAGRWVDPEGGGEAWTRVGEALLGVGWLRGGDGTWSYEVMRVDVVDGLRFTAWPSGQAAAHFGERTRGATEVEFADPGHDFPKVVRYKQRAGGLVARIEGDRPEDGQDFNYVAAPAANAPEAEAADRALVGLSAEKTWHADRAVDAGGWALTREVLASGAAPGGELAYTLGRYARGDAAERGDYVCVWRRGEVWRLELAVLNPE